MTNKKVDIMAPAYTGQTQKFNKKRANFNLVKSYKGGKSPKIKRLTRIRRY